MAQEPGVPAFRYRAFISYSHQDKTWADWLHRSLESYRIPQRLVGQETPAGIVPRRLLPVFRDRDELASATDLGRRVNEALSESANLIVICSPHSAHSHWVNEEVLAFKRLGHADRIFCLIVEGEPNASELHGREAEECFAPALRFEWDGVAGLSEQRTEPIAADARPGKDGRNNSKLKLIAGMLDIGFDKLKQREQQRHQRRLAAVAAVAVAITMMTSTLAVIALHAQRVAERERNQAEGLVSFMLGDLNDKLSQVQRLDIMEAVDDRAMAYFQSLPNDDVTEVSLEQRAKALEKIGTVRTGQGHLEAALQSYQAAAKISAQLAGREPGNVARQVAYSRIMAFVGMTEWFRGNLAEAEKSFSTAQEVLRRTPLTSAPDKDFLQQWATVDDDLGHVLEAQGKLDLAAGQYQAMLTHSRELVRGDHPKTDWQELLGEAHNNLGKIALMQGDLATAIAEYRADDAIETALSEQDPRNHEQRQNMVRVRAIYGRTMALGGDVKTGALHMQQAVDAGLQLTAFEPNDTGFRSMVALYSTQLARLRRLDGDADAAKQLSERSLKIFGELTHQDPSNAEWKQDFAEAQLEQAAQSLAAGRADEAHALAEQAFTVLGPMHENQPAERSLLLDTAAARLLLAATSSDAGKARQWREDVLKDVAVVTSAAADPRLLALRVAALLSLDRPPEAAPFVQQLWDSGYRDLDLLATLKQHGIEYPANAAFQQRLQTALAKSDPQ